MLETWLKQFVVNIGLVVIVLFDGDVYWFDMCDFFIYGDQFFDKYDVWDLENNELVVDAANYYFAVLYVYDGEVVKWQWFDNVDVFFVNVGEEFVENICEDGMVLFVIKGK